MKLEHQDRTTSTSSSTGAGAPSPGKTPRTSRLGIQRRASGGGAEADPGAVYAQATSGAGTSVPYQAEMEHGFGTDFSNVQAYKGKTTEMSALGAHAATQGSDERVAFASETPSKATVAHELAHVVQARNLGGAPAVMGQTAVSQPGDAAERQADAAASVVAGGGSVDPASLTAAGAGIQREDVNVSAGDRTETESTTRVIDHGNNFEDEISAWDKLLAWKNGTQISFARNGSTVTRVPTANDALFFFIELTPAQRSQIWLNEQGILTHIFQNFSNADAAQVMGMCDFPLRWKIIHWFRDIVAGNGGRETVRSMISNSPLGQRLDVVQDESAVDLMVGTLADDHPENLFGDQVKQQLYPDEATALVFDAAHPKYASWRNTAGKLDAEARWALVGADPVNTIATLKTQQATGGRNKWTSLIHWGPRGAALTPTMRENVDKAALDAGVTGQDRADLFQTRWNCPLNDPGASAQVFTEVWNNLKRMPLGTINSETVTRIELRINTSGGAYTDYPDNNDFGGMWIGTNTSLAYAGHTVRHEVGHAADTQLGGFANFSSKPPILWKKWWTQDPWIQEMMGYMDAPTAGPEGQAFKQLMSAAMISGPFVSPFGPSNPPAVGPLTLEQEQARLWDDVATRYNTQGIQAALDALKAAGKHTADTAVMAKIVADGQGGGTHPTSEPGYVRDHYFLKKYGEHFSYHKDGGSEVWGNGKLRAYTLCSPYEYFADMFAAYFETETNRAANVPGWAASYFQSIESRYDSNAVDDPNNRRSTAYGNFQAPQV